MQWMFGSGSSFGTKLGFVLPLIAILSRAVAQEASPSTPSGTSSIRQRIVTLKDGSFYRGVPIEVVPGDHLTLRLASGGIQQIAWTDIVSQTVMSAVPAPSAGPPSGSVRVTLESNDHNVTLYRQAGLAQSFISGIEVDTEPTWEHSCDYPCGRHQSLTDRYMIQGSGISHSKPFTLPVGATDLRLRISAGDNSMRRTGIALIAIGAGLTGLGGAFLATFSIYNTQLLPPNKNDTQYQFSSSSYQQDLQRYESNRTTGLGITIASGILVGVCVPAMIGGIVLLTRNRTKVYVDPDTRLAALRLFDQRNILLSPQGLLF